MSAYLSTSKLVEHLTGRNDKVRSFGRKRHPLSKQCSLRLWLGDQASDAKEIEDSRPKAQVQTATRALVACKNRWSHAFGSRSSQRSSCRVVCRWCDRSYRLLACYCTYTSALSLWLVRPKKAQTPVMTATPKGSRCIIYPLRGAFHGFTPTTKESGRTGWRHEGCWMSRVGRVGGGVVCGIIYRPTLQLALFIFGTGHANAQKPNGSILERESGLRNAC